MRIRSRDRPGAHRLASFGAALPMCLFSAALQSAVATLARIVQGSAELHGRLILMPMIPGVIGVTLSDRQRAPWILTPRRCSVTHAPADQRPRRPNAGDPNAFLASAGMLCRRRHSAHPSSASRRARFVRRASASSRAAMSAKPRGQLSDPGSQATDEGTCPRCGNPAI